MDKELPWCKECCKDLTTIPEQDADICIPCQKEYEESLDCDTSLKRP